MNVFNKILSFLLIVSSFSCGTSKLTNYGRPLSFLSNNRVPRVNTVSQKISSWTFVNESKSISSKTSYDNVNTIKDIDTSFKQDKVVYSNLKKSIVSSPYQNEANFNKGTNRLIYNNLNQKINNLISANKFSNQFNTTSLKKSHPITILNDDVSDLVLLLICLLFPPVAVWWRYDFGEQFWIDLLLYLPMILLSSATFAFIPMLYAIYVCFLKRRGNSGDVRSSW